MSILDKYEILKKQKLFKNISQKGLKRKGFIDDFDSEIWIKRFGIPDIKCIPDIKSIPIIEDDNIVFDKENIGEEIESKSPYNKKGKVVSKDTINGVPIIKLDNGDIENRNPITIDQIKEGYKFFGIPKEHFKGLKEIVITNEIPKDKWAFGTYNIKKEGSKLLDNRITIWGQKIKIINGEIRYIIHPSNVNGPLYLKSERFFYEILGDTIIHEIGHHYDLWINESPIVGEGWIIRAENSAYKYVRSFASIKRRSEDFLSIVRKYGENDNKEILS